MIKAVISRSKEGHITGFCVKGHAGYAEEGHDIICSAVSAITYTALGYIDNVLMKEKECNVQFDESDGKIKWDRYYGRSAIGDICKTEVDAVLEAMVIGFLQIRESYGEKYLRIQYEEVHSKC